MLLFDSHASEDVKYYASDVQMHIYSKKLPKLTRKDVEDFSFLSRMEEEGLDSLSLGVNASS